MEHEALGEGTLGGFSRVYLPVGLLLLGWVFGNDPASDEGLAEGAQELF